MKDFNEIFKEIEKTVIELDERVNRKLSALYDKLEDYRDTFKKNVYGNDKTVKVDVEGEDEDRTVTVTIDGDGKKTKKKDKFAEMAPFLDEDSLHELVMEFINGDLETDMKSILPFLSQGDLSLLTFKLEEHHNIFKGLGIEDLFPFFTEINLDDMFVQKFREGELDASLIPFVSDQGWHELVEAYCEDEESDLDIDAIYPFLNKEDLKLLFKTYLKRRSKKKD